MTSDDRHESRATSEDTTRAGTPFASRSGPPRLRIVHLLGWTLCVALYMGTIQFMTADLLAELRESFRLILFLQDIAAGTALGGLVIWVSWRCRRLQFPAYPGDYLLVATGLGIVAEWVFTLFWLGVASLDGVDPDLFFGPLWKVYALGPPAVRGLVFLWVVWRVKPALWRVFFAVMLAGEVVPLLSFHGERLIQNAIAFAATVALIAVVTRDHLQGKRYPWTHWTGVAVRLWLDILTVASLVLLRLFGPPTV